MRTLGKICSLVLFAALGTAAGIILFSSLMVVKVEGSSMLPALEPGDHVLILQESLLTGVPEIQVGDLVVYEAPYYTTDGEGLQKIRRITGTRGSWLRLNCDVKTVKDQEMLLRTEAIQGKVILVIPRLEIF